MLTHSYVALCIKERRCIKTDGLVEATVEQLMGKEGFRKVSIIKTGSRFNFWNPGYFPMSKFRVAPA